ncbi:FAD-dependent oxidoreductase [Chitinimonas lacunae]|uniref:FAD-dependent oxidoreductase n=1 Tax=Chitinimonas lacunae TaxID=1963018 RepID=A0ABV8MVG2_9NEIS
MSEPELLIVGAGPAGLAAAREAAQAGARVCLLDDNPLPGGQIWRGGPQRNRHPRAHAAFAALSRLGVDWRPGHRVVAAPKAGQLLVEHGSEAMLIRYRRLILAGGARERLLPFPGWTLPGVTGVGGLQALVKGGWPIEGRKVIVAGSGPLLLAAAWSLRKAGARVLMMLEQANQTAIRRFTRHLLGHPAKLLQAAMLKARLADVPYVTDGFVLSALGRDKLEGIRMLIGGDMRVQRCDYLACAFGLLPNAELAELLGCALDGETVAVDALQKTSVAGVYAAGEMTGIGGVDKAEVEGRIAALAALGRTEEALALFRRRVRSHRFAELLQETFALRSELMRLARADTVICRCEDVRMAELARFDDWREAKLQTRCGMGACQGRTCGPACQALFGWPRRGARPPLQPARLETLACDQES